ARSASSTPCSVSWTSTQPANRFFLFQSLSPWRSRIRGWGSGMALVYRGLVTAWTEPAVPDTMPAMPDTKPSRHARDTGHEASDTGHEAIEPDHGATPA